MKYVFGRNFCVNGHIPHLFVLDQFSTPLKISKHLSCRKNNLQIVVKSELLG